MRTRPWDEPYSNAPDSLRVRRKQEAMRALCLQMTGIKTIKDCFGGLGYASAALVEQMPSVRLVVQDLDEGCVDALKKRFENNPRITVRQADFFLDQDKALYDLVLLDMNTFTLKQWRRNPPLKSALARVLSVNQPKYIILSDSLRSRFHWHGAGYGVNTIGGYLTLMVGEVFPTYKMISVEDKVEVCYVLLQRKRG